MWGSKLLSNYGSKALGMTAAYGRGAGAAGRTATYGAAAGAAWGALSNDTSVIGGAMMGAGIGLGGRYARAGMRAGARSGTGMGLGESLRSYRQAFAGGAGRRMARDFSGPRMRANSAYNTIGSTLTWRMP